MPQRVVHESDVSSQLILEEAQHAEALVRGYGELAPRVLDLTVEEAEKLRGLAVDDVVEINLKLPGQDEHERLIVTRRNLGKLAVDRSMDDVMAGARPLVEYNPRPTRNRNTPDYSTPEHAGDPHKGKASPEEGLWVREHLAEVNERLKSEGKRLIDPEDPTMRTRFGFDGGGETQQTLAEAGEPAKAPAAETPATA